MKQNTKKQMKPHAVRTLDEIFQRYRHRDFVPKIPAAHRRDREEFKRFVLAEAEQWHRDHIGRLYECHEKWNVDYFGGQLICPYIMFGEVTPALCFGNCSPVSDFGRRSQIKIRTTLMTGTYPHISPEPEHAQGRFVFVADVTLHEMIHQYQQEVLGCTDSGSSGHGASFKDVCNYIGAKLSLAQVRLSKLRRRPDGSPDPRRHEPSCAHWPHCVRPHDFYQGAYPHHPDVVWDDEKMSRECRLLFCAMRRHLVRFPPERIEQGLQHAARSAHKLRYLAAGASR